MFNKVLFIINSNRKEVKFDTHNIRCLQHEKSYWVWTKIIIKFIYIHMHLLFSKKTSFF